MTSSLFEAIIGSAQSPAQFWLVVDIPNHKPYDENIASRDVKLLTDLSKGELHGVRGISDSREILTNWWMVGRNAAIYMNVAQVIALNDVEKVEYDDPEFLVRNNCSALYRLYNKERRSKGDHTGLMLNIMQQVGQQIRKQVPQAYNNFDYYGFPNSISFAWPDVQDQYDIQTVDDFCRVTYHLLGTTGRGDWENKMILESISAQQWSAAVLPALLNIGRMYSDEAEWLVHSPDFKVPPRSLMLVGIDFEARSKHAEWVAAGRPDNLDWQMYTWRLQNYDRMLAGIEHYGLDKFYTLRFVDSKKFEDMRSVTTGRRRQRAEKAASKAA